MCDDGIDFTRAPPIFWICLQNKVITCKRGLIGDIKENILTDLQDGYLWAELDNRIVMLPEIGKALALEMSEFI